MNWEAYGLSDPFATTTESSSSASGANLPVSMPAQPATSQSIDLIKSDESDDDLPTVSSASASSQAAAPKKPADYDNWIAEGWGEEEEEEEEDEGEEEEEEDREAAEENVEENEEDEEQDEPTEEDVSGMELPVDNDFFKAALLNAMYRIRVYSTSVNYYRTDIRLEVTKDSIDPRADGVKVKNGYTIPADTPLTGYGVS